MQAIFWAELFFHNSEEEETRPLLTESRATNENLSQIEEEEGEMVQNRDLMESEE